MPYHRMLGRAARMRANLAMFERAGGLQTSVRKTGKQWDVPFAWAPMQLIGAEGLRRYGFNEDADRISVKFLSLVLKEFIAHHAIKEKYDAVRRTSDIAAGIKYGYSSNEIGFGWTNAVFEELCRSMARRSRNGPTPDMICPYSSAQNAGFHFRTSCAAFRTPLRCVEERGRAAE